MLGNLHIAFKKDPDLRLDEEEEGEEGGDQVDGEGNDFLDFFSLQNKILAQILRKEKERVNKSEL